MALGNNFLYNNAWIFYIAGVLSLLLVLFFGIEVNNAKCWFEIPFLGTIQPSEFMKIFLIITLSRMITDFNNQYKNPDIEDELKQLWRNELLDEAPEIVKDEEYSIPGRWTIPVDKVIKVENRCLLL